jgi:tetratricopeptide (TPR) repeat protein
MAKVGRNDLCPCGSGKKYKKCCQAKDQEAERQMRAAAQSHAAAHSHLDYGDDCYNEMAEASNAVLDLIEAEKLDEAEQAAQELLERFPETYDGYARLGLIHEIRGDNQKAIECYRKVMAFLGERVDRDAPIRAADYQELIDRLQQPAAG